MSASSYAGCLSSLVLRDLDEGAIVCPFPASNYLPAPHPYRMKAREESAKRPQLQKFMAWLRKEADITRQRMDGIVQSHGHRGPV